MDFLIIITINFKDKYSIVEIVFNITLILKEYKTVNI